MDPGGQYHHHHHHQHHQYSGVDTPGSSGSDRFPQWSIQETRDFLTIRAELDPTFMETKRNKLLWEVIATRMKEKGYNRSAEQCKCKWKNLVTRYKGCETMEAEGMRQQFPFYSELQTIFAARMQRMLWLEAEGGGGGKKKAASAQQQQQQHHLVISSEEDDGDDDSEGEIKGTAASASVGKKKRKLKSGAAVVTNKTSGNAILNGMREMMEEFTRQQAATEAEWLRASEAREEARRAREMEWRQTMEALENERMMMERRWREREEQRRLREDARAEKRDALITALLNKLRREE